MAIENGSGSVQNSQSASQSTGSEQTSSQSTANAGGQAPDTGNNGTPAQPGQAPVSNNGQANQQAGAGGSNSQAPGQGEQPPAQSQFDQQTQDWLKSKGIDPAKPDISKLIENTRNLERSFTQQRQQASQVQQPPAQAIEQSQTIQQAAGTAPVEMSPLDEFDEAHKYNVELYCHAYGCNSLEELEQANPGLAASLDRIYNKGRQKAWEATQQWKEKQAEQKATLQKQQQQFALDLQNAEIAAKNNLATFSKDYPELNQNFEKLGVNKLLSFLEDQYVVPRNFILSQPEFAEFLSKAVRGIDLMANIEAHDQKVKEAYEKELLKSKSAQLPSSQNSNDSNPAKAGLYQSSNRGGVSTLD